MIRVFLLVWLSLLIVPVEMTFAQTAQVPAVMELTLQDAERRAIDRNPDLAAARLGTEAADFGIAQARAVFSPTFSTTIARDSEKTPSTSQLSGGDGQVSTNVSTYNSGLSQFLPWGGGSLAIDYTSGRTSTSNTYATYNPRFDSALATTLTQPLLRGFTFDQNRADIAQASVTRSLADITLRSELATTLAAVRTAYWQLVYTTDNRETARRSETLAVQQRDDNQRRLELGTVAQIDVLESDAEVASRHQTVVQADGDWRDAQVALKQLIVSNTSDPLWASTIAATDRPTIDARTLDVDAAITTALANRADIAEARQNRASTDINLRLLDDQRKPAVDLVTAYTATGIAGTRGTTTSTNYWDSLRTLGDLKYPAWSAAVNVSVPVGNKAAKAAYARGMVARRQNDAQIAGLELGAAAEVTRAAEQVRTAEEQIRSATAARDLAARRLDAEDTRRNVGLSTTFLVLQAQRDLATAETTLLQAQLNYRNALVTFELAQEAPTD